MSEGEFDGAWVSEGVGLAAGIGRLVDRIGMVAWSVASPVGDRFAIR